MIQIIVSYISVLFFYDILNKVLKKSKISYIVTFLYGISPSVIGWDKIILTESLALSGTVFFIWLLIKYLEKPSFVYGVWINILIAALVFLRPTFLVNYCIVVVFWSIRYFMYSNEKRILIKNLIGAFGVGLFVIGYCAKFNEQYGIFTLSATKAQQDCITIVQHSLWNDVKNLNETDVNILKTILENNSLDDERGCIKAAGEVLGSFDLKEIAVFNNKVKKTREYFKHKCWTFFLLADIDLSNNVWYGTNIYTSNVLYNEDQIPLYSVHNSMTMRKVVNIWRRLNPTIRFIHIYLICVIELVIIVKNLLKRKDTWVHLGIAGFLLSISLTSIWGTCGEWGRTAICVLPYAYLAIAIYMQFLIEKIVKNYNS